MPARSKKQQRLFGMIHALQKGTLSPKKVSSKVRSMAKKIDPTSVSHFASTKHKKLPEKRGMANAKLDDAFISGFLHVCDSYNVSPHALLKIATPTVPSLDPTIHYGPEDTVGKLMEHTRFGKRRINWDGISSYKAKMIQKREISDKYLPKPEQMVQ